MVFEERIRNFHDYQHFAESITEADEDEEGLCCALLCRALLVAMCYTTMRPREVARSCGSLWFRVNTTACSGNCEHGGNSFRVFVIVDTDQCYPEYILWHRRIFGDTAYLNDLDPLEPSALDVPATRLVYPAGAYHVFVTIEFTFLGVHYIVRLAPPAPAVTVAPAETPELAPVFLFA